ncbi:MAG: hypothetical protein ABI995_02785 [Acidobacteriota bacterium]
MWSRLFSFPAMLAAGLTFLVFWSCAPRFDDPDLWWHLKLGETIWTTHQIPAIDQFSFTAYGHPWIAHEWLSQVMMYGLYNTAGYSGLLFELCVTSSAVVVLAYVLCGLWSGNWKVSLIGGIGALFFLTTSLAIRPLLIGHLFLMVELLLLYAGLVRGSRAILALPVLFVIWANCHGSFFFGFVPLFLALVFSTLKLDGKRLRLRCERSAAIRGLVILGACLLAPFVNPVGPSLAFYPIDVLFFQPDNTANVQEWAALDILDPRGMALMGTLGLIAMMAVAFRKRVIAGEWFALLAAAGMAMQHMRMLPIFGFVAGPVVCRLLADSWDNWDARRDHPAINAILIATAAAFSLLVLPTSAEIAQQVTEKEPVAAVAKLKEAGWDGPILNEYIWGGYLMWSLPDQRVFIDGRTDIYAWTGVLREYGKWTLLEEDPKILLDRYKIQTCLLRAAAPMARVMPYLPGWKQVYADNLAVVFTRDPI